MRLRSATVGAVLGAVLAVVGCGGDDPPPPPPPKEERRSDPDRPFAEVGEAFHGVRRQVETTLGVEAVKRTEPRLELWARGAGATAVVVHGIDPVEGQLDAVAGWLADDGYRVFLYRWDDKAHLDEGARRLGELLGSELDQRPSAEVTIVAHSLGGLVSRRALTVGHASGLADRPERLRLVTIASPFGGFEYADHARRDMGFGADSWQDVGRSSRFVSRPGDLGQNVVHWKLETDEEGQLRRHEGRRVKDDVVRLPEQRNVTVDAQASERRLLPLGHVGAVLDDGGRLPSATAAALAAALRR